MSTIKQDRIDLEKLLNGIDPLERQSPISTTSPVNVQPAPSPTTAVDNTGSEGLNVERVFEFDYEGTKKGLRKRARKTVISIIRLIFSDDSMLEEDYIKDKMEQDIDLFTDLYVQQETNLVMQKALLETVSRGNMMPRMFEVYNQMTGQAQNINKQIIETEQRIRKTYLDLKYEVQDKRTEQATALPSGSTPQNALLTGGILVTDTKSLISDVKAKHIEKMKSQNSYDD